MKPLSLVGVLLIAVGLLALVARGFSYTTKDKVVDLGPIEASKETTHTVPIPQIAGILALASGVVLVVVGTRQT
jgi:UDP-N-acetylmuramyl pentapeptide phosphotransferase/UDP-N-acetylglucosamine-1-phosphate transferase